MVTRYFSPVFLVLLAVLTFGCVPAPQGKAAWPWEKDNDFDRLQTGNFLGVTAGVAQFGDAPKAAKPVNPEALNPPPMSDVPNQPLPAASAKGMDSVPLATPPKAVTVNGEYDFTVSAVDLAPPAYLTESPRKHEITAFNHGNAPVSVAINVDISSSQNWTSDEEIPVVAMIPPKSDRTVVHFRAKNKNQVMDLRYNYSWALGDRNARHLCPEHYQFPFGENVRAWAIPRSEHSREWDRYSVSFILPAGTPVFVARKGVVAQVSKYGEIDVLHNDGTLAAYQFAGKFDEKLVGREVSTEDVIGIAETPGNEMAWLEISVWRPEPRQKISSTGLSTLSMGRMTFPIEFCTSGAKQCRILTQEEYVSRNMARKKSVKHHRK